MKDEGLPVYAHACNFRNSLLCCFAFRKIQCFLVCMCPYAALYPEFTFYTHTQTYTHRHVHTHHFTWKMGDLRRSEHLFDQVRINYFCALQLDKILVVSLQCLFALAYRRVINCNLAFIFWYIKIPY